MPRREGPPQLMRIVEGLRGRVPMRMDLRPRFDYGAIAPMVEPRVDGAAAYVGLDALHLSTPVDLAIEDRALTAEFTLPEGARGRFVMSWHESGEPAPPTDDAQAALARTEAWWQEWSDRCTYEGDWREAVVRSLIVLKALTHETTGGIVAAPTLRCRRTWAACATGTTASAGCATRRSPCARCSPRATPRRRSPSGSGQGAPPPATHGTCRSCTGSVASATCPRWSSTGSPATRDRSRCAWATRRPTSSSWTCMARSSACSTSGLHCGGGGTRGVAAGGRSRSSTRCGASPTRGCGRCVGRGATSRIPR